MSLTIFLALCILGCDFMIFMLYQWVYGEKYRAHARRAAVRNSIAKLPSSQPYLVS